MFESTLQPRSAEWFSTVDSAFALKPQCQVSMSWR